MPLRILLGALFALLLTGCLDAAAGEPTSVEPVAIIDPAPTAPIPSDPVLANIEPISFAPVREFAITARQWEFTPSVIEVNQGDTVRITLTNIDVSHGISIPALNVDFKVAAGATDTVEFVASKAGEFPFYCNVFCGVDHNSMTGLLIVK